MTDVPSPPTSSRQRRRAAWLIAPLLAGAVAVAVLSGRQEVISALPLLVVAGFYFALYRGGSLHNAALAEEPDRTADTAKQPAPEAVTPVRAPWAALRSIRSFLASMRPSRRANPADADLFGRLAMMAAAERRREVSRQPRSRA